MAKSRELVSEIISMQARTKSSGMYEYYGRLNSIRKAFDEILDNSEKIELLRYIPISTVACIQGFFRCAIKQLIDSGEPFYKNVANFKGKAAPPDYDIIAAIQKNLFTVGEFIAHTLSFNDYESIIGNISILINEDFESKLKSYDTNETQEALIQNSFEEVFPEIRNSVCVIFKMRHAFCHEFASNVKLEEKEIRKHFQNAEIFLNRTHRVINNILFPNSKLFNTQLEMNQESQKSFIKRDEELNKIINKIKTLRKEPFYPWNEEECKSFDRVQEKWREYREAYATECSNPNKGGSIHSLVYNIALEQITDERIDGLKKNYQDLLNDKREFSF